MTTRQKLREYWNNLSSEEKAALKAKYSDIKEYPVTKAGLRMVEYFRNKLKTHDDKMSIVLNDLIYKYSSGIVLNANDFFAYASADCVTIDSLDLEWALPIIDKHGEDGIFAVMSYIAKCQPIPPHVTEAFTAAFNEIVALDPKVYSDYYNI